MHLPNPLLSFPKDFVLQFCGPTGADGTEAAIKLAKTYTGRDNVIAFSGGYHGMTPWRACHDWQSVRQRESWQFDARVQFMPYPHEYPPTWLVVKRVLMR